MAEHEEKAESDETNLGKPALWAGIIGAPMIWLTQFLICYALVPYVCHTRKFFSMHLTIAIALILVAGAGGFCWRNWGGVGVCSWPRGGGWCWGSRSRVVGGGVGRSSVVRFLFVAQRRSGG